MGLRLARFGGAGRAQADGMPFTVGESRLPSRRRRRAARRLRKEEDSVTPVVGTILILGITVAGIAAILVWGAPAIARIQAQNAQLAMQGEFEDLRASAQELSVPDHSRFPSVALTDGTLLFEPGSRIMVTANHDDAAHAGCDFRVTSWSETSGSDKDKVTVASTGCVIDPVSTAALEVYEVTGGSLVSKSDSVTGATATVAGVDFSTGDWAFMLKSGTTIVAEAWLISTDRITWTIQSAQDRSVYLDGGAIFAETDGTLFLDKGPALGDSAFGPDYVGLWLRTFDASSYDAVAGRGSYQVYLALTGNHLRIDQQAVYKVRYDIAGDLAQAWCNSLVLRENNLADASYAALGGTCATGDADGVRSVLYAKDDAGSFEYRLLQAQIYVSLIA